jgi:hypothetical protein
VAKGVDRMALLQRGSTGWLCCKGGRQDGSVAKGVDRMAE